MHARQLLASAIHFLVVVFVFGVGIFFLFLPKSLDLRLHLSRILSEEPQLFSWIGLICLALGIALFTALFATHRGSYYKVKMKQNELSIDLDLVRELGQNYWNELFPGRESLVKVSLCPKKDTLEFTAQIPADAVGEDQSETLERIENELGERLASYLGYNRDFQVTLLLK